MKRRILTILAIFGFAGLVAHTIIFVLFKSPFYDVNFMPSDATVVGSFMGPDGVYKAVVFNQNGGGGLAPYCIDHLSIVYSSVPDELAWGDQKNALTSGCGGLEFGSWGNSVNWTSARELQLRVNLTLGTSNVDYMRLHAFAGHNGEVRINYVR